MADYYTPTVLQQSIPDADMTPLERLLLTHIFDAERDGDGWYFFSEQGPADMLYVERAALEDALAASEMVGENTANTFVRKHLPNRRRARTRILINLSITLRHEPGHRAGLFAFIPLIEWRPIMGWLYMQSLNGYFGPRQYLDAQFTHTRPELTSKVLRSALLAMRVYYAAVEHVRHTTDERTVFAAVCLVRYNPRDREGYIFGYKDMEESMGPCESECPTAILDLLTPTNSRYAIEWRARCRENTAARRALANKPSPRPGQTIVFDRPLSFSNGRTLDRFEVVANPRSHRTVLFRAADIGGLYRISHVKKHTYRLIDSA